MSDANNMFQKSKGKKKLESKHKVIIIFIALTLIVGTMDLITMLKLPKNSSYSNFESEVLSGNVNSLLRINSDSVIFSKNHHSKFDILFNYVLDENSKVVSLSFTDNIKEMLLSNNVEINTGTSYLLPIYFSLLILLFYVFMVYIIAVKFFPVMVGMSTGVYRAAESTTNVKFKDIIGHDEIISDMQDIMNLMKNSTNYKDLNVRMPKGVLLVGPPGTGKTMIAKALANEAGLKFLYVNTSSVIDKYVGQGASNIRNIFKKAKRLAPCILFFDELDVLGGDRDKMEMTEYTQTLSELLTQLDGFDTGSGVYIVGATNRIDSIDPALKRTGRFDRIINVNPPRNVSIRISMIKSYVGDIGENLDYEYLAKQMSGFTGSDIAVVINEAKLIAIQNESHTLKQEFILEALDKHLLHGNRTKNDCKDDMSIISIHETGHALVSYLKGLKISRISIVPNTSGVGGMVGILDEDSNLMTKSVLRSHIVSLYAGRAAEELICGEDMVTIGASNDFEKATELIKEYIGKYNFNNHFGHIVFTNDNKNPFENKEFLDCCIEFSSSLYFESKKLLEENQSLLVSLSKVLLEKETMDGNEFVELVEEYKNKK